MIGHSPDQNQLNLFGPVLKQITDPEHPLIKLSLQYPWRDIETAFESLYSDIGSPAKPIRLMSGLLMLKHMHSLSDRLTLNQWVQNPYFQFFCGGAEFQWEPPCDEGEMVQFRRRIGQQGIERIFSNLASLHDKQMAVKYEEHEESTEDATDDDISSEGISFRKIFKHKERKKKQSSNEEEHNEISYSFRTSAFKRPMTKTELHRLLKIKLEYQTQSKVSVISELNPVVSFLNTNKNQIIKKINTTYRTVRDKASSMVNRTFKNIKQNFVLYE